MFPKKDDNPIQVFANWFDEAKNCKHIAQPEAVNVATATTDGIPSSRMVLLKDFDEQGFVFFTNYGSQKAAELDTNPNAAMCFFWQEIGKQVRIAGSVERVSSQESDEYFATRAKQSQIGAWSSKQSQPLSGKKQLIADIAKVTLKYNIGKVPRPEFWGGYRIKPKTIEFWNLGEFRIHDRLRFEKSGKSWQTTNLYP